jgi:hypothetical protein
MAKLGEDRYYKRSGSRARSLFQLCRSRDEPNHRALSTRRQAHTTGVLELVQHLVCARLGPAEQNAILGPKRRQHPFVRRVRWLFVQGRATLIVLIRLIFWAACSGAAFRGSVD